MPSCPRSSSTCRGGGRARTKAAIGHATSSGLACGATLEEAVLAGLLELVERDAFMLVWHNRLSLPLLDWSADPEVVELDRRYFAPTGLDYSAVDLSVFLDVPTVLGVVHGPPAQLGALGVGAASAPTVAGAWRKALAEAFSVQRWVRDRRPRGTRAARSARPRRSRPSTSTRSTTPTEERALRAAFLDRLSRSNGDHCGSRPWRARTSSSRSRPSPAGSPSAALPPMPST